MNIMKILNIFRFANLCRLWRDSAIRGKRRGGWRDSGLELRTAKQKREFEKELLEQGHCRTLAKIMVAEQFAQSKPN